MIYVILQGRIGNQLFMYACARTLQKRQAPGSKIILDDVYNIRDGYANSLIHYPLPDVEYVHDMSQRTTPRWALPALARRGANHFENRLNYRERFEWERKCQGLYNALGLIKVENDYLPLPRHLRRNVMLDGFFQTEEYFRDNREELLELFSLKERVDASGYPNLAEIMNRNTVCVSIKVQHNAGNPMYDVCGEAYYRTAIRMITERVDRPLFFICSDNVPYVKEHLIDTSRYDTVEQSADFPVHLSLAVMARSKHFIIGNTSFGWWAQYLCRNPEKIVIAPSRWYGIDVPCEHIYQPNWTLIQV